MTMTLTVTVASIVGHVAVSLVHITMITYDSDEPIRYKRQ